MHRRTLFATAAGAFLGMALPNVAVAKAPTPFPEPDMYDKLASVQTVFNTLHDYKFEFETQALQFGADLNHMSTFAQLRDFVHERAIESGNTDIIWSRIGAFMTIRQRLDWRLGDQNTKKHLLWLEAHEPIPGQSCLSMMQGTWADIMHAADYVAHEA